MANKKIPITRISRFFSSEDFQLEQNVGMGWLHGDMHFTLVLFRVDSKLSDVDDVYGESGPEEIRYKTPVEFNAYVKWGKELQKKYPGTRDDHYKSKKINPYALMDLINHKSKSSDIIVTSDGSAAVVSSGTHRAISREIDGYIEYGW